jgi:anti-sigma B factor antagonist
MGPDDVRLDRKGASMQLAISSEQQGEIAILAVAGEIDLWTAEEFRQSLRRTQATNERVVVDLSDVPFVDSSGLGVLVGGLKRARDVDGSLHLVVTSPAVRRVFTLTNLDQVIPLHESVADAVAVASALGSLDEELDRTVSE